MSTTITLSSPRREYKQHFERASFAALACAVYREVALRMQDPDHDPAVTKQLAQLAFDTEPFAVELPDDIEPIRAMVHRIYRDEEMTRARQQRRRRLAAMSEITDRIQAYVDRGRNAADWPALRDWLAHHTYAKVQSYEDGDPAENAIAERDWDTTYTDGSWDEVLRALDRNHLLTRSEYFEVLEQMQAARA